MIDKFYLHKIFPEPDKVFSFDYKSYPETKNNCLFVVDTNILFVPFQTSKKGLSDIKTIFERLKRGNRLFIPSRVAREFAKNRGENLATVYRKAEEATERTNKIDINLGNFPILLDNAHYQSAKEIEKLIIEKVDELRGKLKELKEDVKKWNWDDPVSELYRTIFTSEIIIDTTKTEAELEKDLEFRIEHQIAPGYKDSNKIDKGIGDKIVPNISHAQYLSNWLHVLKNDFRFFIEALELARTSIYFLNELTEIYPYLKSQKMREVKVERIQEWKRLAEN